MSGRQIIFISLSILSSLLINSCATLLNSDDQSIIITNHPKITHIKIDSGNVPLYVDNNIWVNRNKKPLIVHCLLDSIPKTIQIPAGYSKAWFWNLNPYAGYGIGFIFDRNTPRKYAYPSSIHFDVKDSNVVWSRFKPIKKGSVFIDISIPYVNLFRTQTHVDYYSALGFMGLQAGLEFYYDREKFISFSAGSALDFPIPVPAPIHYPKAFESTGLNYFTVRNNFAKKTFELGYGLSYSKFTWTKRDEYFEFYKRVNYNIGLSFSAFWRRGVFYRVGLIYNPGLVLLNPKVSLEYEHLISLVFSWKIPLYKAK